MSWYKEKVSALMESAAQNKPSHMPCGKLYNQYGKELSFTINITNMNTEEDKDRITERLLSIAGVTHVKPILHQKKIIVTFNTIKTNLEAITFALAKLGYHYVQKG